MTTQQLKDHLTSHPNEDFTYQQLGELIGRSSSYAGELVNKLAAGLPAEEGQIVKHRESNGSPMLVHFEPAFRDDHFTWKAGDLTAVEPPKARPRWR